MYPDFDTIERAKQRLRDVWAYRRVDHIPVFIRATAEYAAIMHWRDGGETL